jgi:hypothetical protein
LGYVQHGISDHGFPSGIVDLNHVGGIPPLSDFDRNHRPEIPILRFVKIGSVGSGGSGFFILCEYLLEHIGGQRIAHSELVLSFDDMVHFQIVGILGTEVGISLLDSQWINVKDERIQQAVVGSADPSVGVIDDLIVFADLLLYKKTWEKVNVILLVHSFQSNGITGDV